MRGSLKQRYEGSWSLILDLGYQGLSHTLLKISDGSDDFLRDVLRGLSESELLIAGS